MAKNPQKHQNGTARKEPYPYEAFVKNWTKANSLDEVVSMTGLTKNTVSAMSGRLRKQGVKLKIMPRRAGRPVDVKALNKIIQDVTA